MRKKRICILLAIIMVMTGIFPTGFNNSSVVEVSAGELDGTDTALEDGSTGQAVSGPALEEAASQGNLRLIFTTDIHGQVTNYNYQTGKTLNRGLNKTYTMIQAARAEAGEGNYFTFDLGDSVMDFNSDYIYSQDTESLQPVYNAMSMINYDAITLGNHDFDFGYDYIVNQLEMSGLMDKCVLSNVYSSINGDSIFGVENKIIEKQVHSDAGTDLTVKIGLIGEVTPGLSTRTEGYKNKLVAEDIIENAKKQAAALKEQGADIIIALAHSGFGTETPSARAANTAYALTKIDGIDVVLAGHDHIDFPVDNKNDLHYSLPGVDKETDLVNGKRLVMIKDSCRGIGVVDLKLKAGEDNKIVIDNSSYEIRKVTEDTEANHDIENTMSAWDAKLKEYCQKEVGTIPEGGRWDNYNSLIGSNEIMQAVHNAQIEYASNYIINNAPQYKDYPIVSIGRYTKYGSDSGADYADLSGTIVEGNADSFANYHRYVYIYTITGKQLREWMEWGASIYQTTDTSSEGNWNNILLSDFIQKENGNSLVQEDFLTEWNRFFQFEGVEYKINPSALPRYDYDGNMINDSYRVQNITRNGVPVNDDDTFILVTDKITPGIQSEANKGVDKQVVSKSHVILQDIVQQYLAEKALLGELTIPVSHSWELALPDNYKYILASGTGSEQEFLSQEWCKGLYGTIAYTNYYSCQNINKDNVPDTDAPGVVLSSSNTAETNTSVNISVVTNDKSGINSIKYIYGVYDNKDDEVWTTIASGSAISAAGGSFEAEKNGVYSVYVKDGAGNITIEKIAVTNIYPEILLKPVVDTFDNKDTKVTGKAEPNLTVCVTAGDDTLYEEKAGVDGSFTVKIPTQKAKKKLYVYVSDGNGRESKKTTVVVKRVGPNCPSVTSAKNNDTKITGNANDTNVKIFAVMDNNVYVSKSLGASYYTKCKKYDKDLTIKKVNITIKNNGAYTIDIPNQYSGTEFKIFSVDKLGRVSHARSKKITNAAPNRVTLYQASNVERHVYGHVPDGNKCTVVLKTANKTYKAVTDEEGYFTASVGILGAGTDITVHAYKNSGGTNKKGYPKTYTVEDANELYKELRDVNIHIDKVTDKDKNISGKWTETDSDIYVCADSREYITTTDEDGRYNVDIKARLAIDTPVYVLSRNTKGGINGIRIFKVVLGTPITPVVVGSINTSTKYVKVYTKENCEVTLKAGSKKYVKSSGTYNSSTKRYYYTFRISAARAGANIRAYAKNKAGSTASKIKKVKKVRTSKSKK